MSAMKTPSAAISMLCAAAVSARTDAVMEAARLGQLATLDIVPVRLADTVQRVLEEIGSNYPDYQIPPYGCWRSFEAGGQDRWPMLAGAREFHTAEEMLRSAGDLAVLTSVMNVALQPNWRFIEPVSGQTWDGACGRALAAFSMFAAGAFSAEPQDPLRVDAHALIRMEREEVAAGFQLGEGDNAKGIAALTGLLKRFGEAMALRPDLFEKDGGTRPGCLVESLFGRARDGVLDAEAVLDAVLEGLSPLWQGGAVLDDVILGDAWQHSGLVAGLPAPGIVPFHLPALEIVYGLIEPLAWAGCGVENLEKLPGLANLQHAALFLANGVIVPRLDNIGAPIDGAVELRAVTLGLLSQLAQDLRAELDAGAEALPLSCIMESGTMPAGRKILRENPEVGQKAAKILGNGGVFWLPFRA